MPDYQALGRMHRPKDIDKEDVRDALREEGSVYGAAKVLDITRQTVYGYMKRNGWENPKTGRVPGQDDE